MCMHGFCERATDPSRVGNHPPSGQTAEVSYIEKPRNRQGELPLESPAPTEKTKTQRILRPHFDCNPRWLPGIVARGGKVNARDAKGNTALFQSCTVEGVRALLKAGADPSVRNKDGKTAIEAVYTSENDKRAVVIREFIATHLSGSH